MLSYMMSSPPFHSLSLSLLCPFLSMCLSCHVVMQKEAPPWTGHLDLGLPDHQNVELSVCLLYITHLAAGMLSVQEKVDLRKRTDNSHRK